MSFNPSCKYSVYVSGVKEAEGANYARAVTFHFYAPFQPFWGTLEAIKADLRMLSASNVPVDMLYCYVYQASLDIWKALKRRERHNQQDRRMPNPNPPFFVAPDVTLSLDEIMETSTGDQLKTEDMVEYLEGYVRYRTEYLILVAIFPFLALEGAGQQKTLGDFSVRLQASVAELRRALDANIVPQMNVFYHALIGDNKVRGLGRVTVRGSSERAEMARAEARQHFPSGIRQRRNWEGHGADFGNGYPTNWPGGAPEGSRFPWR